MGQSSHHLGQNAPSSQQFSFFNGRIHKAKENDAGTNIETHIETPSENQPLFREEDMKANFQNKNDETLSMAAPQAKPFFGPSQYEMEYLQQVVSELEIFLRSKSISTVKNIHLGFQGDDYRGQLLISRGA